MKEEAERNKNDTDQTLKLGDSMIEQMRAQLGQGRDSDLDNKKVDNEQNEGKANLDDANGPFNSRKTSNKGRGSAQSNYSRKSQRKSQANIRTAPEMSGQNLMIKLYHKKIIYLI